MVVNLYTVRVVLATLGAEDYGIYYVVAGVVTIFNFLSGSIASAAQRYLAFEIGRGNLEQLKKIFSVVFIIFLIVGAVILVAGETAGLWFVTNKLVLPVERLDAARVIYQFAILSFIFTLATIPYMASVIAHEDMSIYGYVSIAEVLLKLAVVYVLRLSSVDKLKLYGFLICAVSFINTSIYRFICTKKYKECKLRPYWDFSLLKELTGFIGWSIFAYFAGIVKNQGITIILNMFLGPLINASYAIATQISGVVLQFSNNFIMALKPSFVKYYALGNREMMLAFFFSVIKVIYFLMLLFILPLQIELNFVIMIWLKQVPDYVEIFTRVMLLDALFESIIFVLEAVSLATGKIKYFFIAACSIGILNLPISLFLLLLEYSAVSILVVRIMLSIIAYCVLLIILSRQLQFSIALFIRDVMVPIVFVSIVSCVVPFSFVWMYPSYPSGLNRLILIVLLTTVSIILSLFLFGLKPEERLFAMRKIKYCMHYVKRRRT